MNNDSKTFDLGEVNVWKRDSRCQTITSICGNNSSIDSNKVHSWKTGHTGILRLWTFIQQWRIAGI